MFERLSKESESAIARAEEIARRLGQEYIGSEHLLMAIAESKDPAGVILAKHKITSASLELRIGKLICSKSPVKVTGQLPPSPHLKHVIEIAIEWAQRMGESHVEPKHTVLAMLGEAGSVAHVAIEDMGADVAEIKGELLAL